MGTRNWQLIHNLELAKRAGRTEEVSQLAVLVEASQEECEHPVESRQVGVSQKETTTKRRGTIHIGDEIIWCHACSCILRHTPKRS